MKKYTRLTWTDFENAHFGKTYSRSYLTSKELKSIFLKDNWSEVTID